MRVHHPSSILRLVMLLWGAAWLPACAPTPPVETSPAPPVSALVRIDVRVGASLMADGASQPLTATGTFDDGATADLTDLVAWSSSDETVATVDVANASLLATGPGSATVTATLGAIRGSATVSITAALRSIVVSPGSTRIAPCRSRQLAAIASFSDGTQRDITAQAQWSSSDTTVATVSADGGVPGLLVAFGAGPVTISARWNGAAGSLALVADPTVAKTVAVSPTNLTVTAGDAIGFTVTATYCDQSTADVTMAAAWSSSSPDVATITDVQAGMHIANATRAGMTVISAQLDDVSDAIELQVAPPTLRSVFVNLPTGDASAPTLAAGASMSLTATAEYSDGSSLDVTSSVAWSSSSPSTATVSSDGVVTALAPGEVTIMVSMNGHFGSAALSVTP